MEAHARAFNASNVETLSSQRRQMVHKQMAWVRCVSASGRTSHRTTIDFSTHLDEHIPTPYPLLLPVIRLREDTSLFAFKTKFRKVRFTPPSLFLPSPFPTKYKLLKVQTHIHSNACVPISLDVWQEASSFWLGGCFCSAVSHSHAAIFICPSRGSRISLPRWSPMILYVTTKQ